MHGSVRVGKYAQTARVRAILRSRNFADLRAAWLTPPCSNVISDSDPEFRPHLDMLRALRAPEDVEPGPGFYARVLQRIEERAKKSIWWVFAYSPIGKRLAYVSLATAIVLGSYVVAQESHEGTVSRTGTLLAAGESAMHDGSNLHYDAPVIGDPDQQREAVLENFASHPGKVQ